MELGTPEEECLVARAWQKVLGLDTIRSDVTLFDLGGTSLSVLRIQAELEQQTGHLFPASAFFDHPTIGSFAAFLRSQTAQHAPQDAKPNRASRRKEFLAQRRLRSFQTETA